MRVEDALALLTLAAAGVAVAAVVDRSTRRRVLAELGKQLVELKPEPREPEWERVS